MPNILLIEDNDLVRKSLRGLLTRLNHTVTEAADGTSGLDLVRQCRFDLVITDLIMPGITGEEVIRVVREISPTTKILAITGQDVSPGMVDPELASRLGSDETLTKPFLPWDLMEVLDRLT